MSHVRYNPLLGRRPHWGARSEKNEKSFSNWWNCFCKQMHCRILTGLRESYCWYKNNKDKVNRKAYLDFINKNFE